MSKYFELEIDENNKVTQIKHQDEYKVTNEEKIKMNDFTKEELEKIIDSFDWIEGETSWDWEHPLRNKIQSMIDNYQEIKIPKVTDYE